eukprot:CAMPEP_0117060486 /NCGR_PEP_ID=MMETSP0472-20121206/42055_1 /TAXON_ID=693140 ORGANISM="Tiarina fusus, Strain LIS" /NCGR_SAMPLE_ID=MMETSP0472 /ASSEMBLY_ACC=CAM_ASM_000603 /LENGTH=65 /DNA_ID=CAMNT_0004778681 /DNA_START=11 /DNA_END=204 /DNA_ORIENTATION=+
MACYAFQRGECDRGSSCRFSHDENFDESAPRQQRSAGACYAFQRGECDRGDGCRFSHEEGAGGDA